MADIGHDHVERSTHREFDNLVDTFPAGEFGLDRLNPRAERREVAKGFVAGLVGRATIRS